MGTLTQDLGERPTHIGKLVDTLPVAYGTANACGIGMGCTRLSPNPEYILLLWCAQLPPKIQHLLDTWENHTGTISNSELELATKIAEQDVLVQHRGYQEPLYIQ
jgi:hypothetical protein